MHEDNRNPVETGGMQEEEAVLRLHLRKVGPQRLSEKATEFEGIHTRPFQCVREGRSRLELQRSFLAIHGDSLHLIRRVQFKLAAHGALDEAASRRVETQE